MWKKIHEVVVKVKNSLKNEKSFFIYVKWN